MLTQDTNPVAPRVIETPATDLFTLDRVVAKLVKLNGNKSPGLDGVHPRLLRLCAHQIAPMLLGLFQHSLNTGSLPSSWKLSVTSPIYKGGDRLEAKNYRPVALLPVVSKIMESIIDDDMRHRLDLSSFFHVSQHDFRRNHSCTTNLVTAMEAWTMAFDAGQTVDALYLALAHRRHYSGLHYSPARSIQHD